MTKVETPLKWLLNELPALIEPAPLASLMERYRLHRVAYERQVKISAAEQALLAALAAYEAQHTGDDDGSHRT